MKGTVVRKPYSLLKSFWVGGVSLTATLTSQPFSKQMGQIPCCRLAQFNLRGPGGYSSVVGHLTASLGGPGQTSTSFKQTQAEKVSLPHPAHWLAWELESYMPVVARQCSALVSFICPVALPAGEQAVAPHADAKNEPSLYSPLGERLSLSKPRQGLALPHPHWWHVFSFETCLEVHFQLILLRLTLVRNPVMNAATLHGFFLLLW